MAGQIKNDIEQGRRVRRLLLNEVERLFTTDPLRLSEPETTRKNELLLRMAPNLLPRLNQHSSPEGGPVQLQQITGMLIQNDGESPEGQNNIQNQESKADTSSPVLD